MARSTKRGAQAQVPIEQSVRGFIPPQNDAERFLMRHVEDMCALAQKRGMVRYTDFLSDREQILANAAISKGDALTFEWVGGMPDAERKLLCIVPLGEEATPPIACVRLRAVRTAGVAPPQHKDYLGSLMHLSFERACIGDIFLPQEEMGTAYLFVLQSILPVVLQEVRSVGHISVEAEEISLRELPAFAKTARTAQTATVASLRLDAVLACMLRCSRGEATDYITQGRVSINHVTANAVHVPVYAQDVFTVRGKGRFSLVSVQGKSKKDRFIIEYFQF